MEDATGRRTIDNAKIAKAIRRNAAGKRRRSWGFTTSGYQCYRSGQYFTSGYDLIT